MTRYSALIVGLSMVVIAGSVGVVLYLQYGLTLIEATLASTLVLLVLVLFHAQFQRERDREALEEKLDDIRLLKAEHERAMEDIQKDLAIHQQTLPDQIRHAVDPITAEMEVLGVLFRQLAETAAAMDARLQALEDWRNQQRPVPPPATHAAHDRGSPTPIDPRQAPPLAPVVHQPPLPQPSDSSQPSQPVTPQEKRINDATQALIAMVRRSVSENRIDLHLQPIVTLPQRQVFAYEALTRIRDDADGLLMPDDYIPAAEYAGVMPLIDNMMLLRSVQVLRRLNQRKRDLSLFCNISQGSLVNGEFFGNFLTFMESNQELVNYLIFEFSHATVREMGPLEYETLTSLTDMGFRFSMDQVDHLRVDFRELNRLGFDYVKVPADKLISGWPDSGSDIHAADLPKLLARNGLTMIADKIETEATVIEALECDAQFGQGYLFAPPRPVRAEAFRSERDTTSGRRAAE